MKIGLLGGSGRMGLMIRTLMKSEFKSQCRLAAAPVIGAPLEPLFMCDIIIDFSSPAGLRALVAASRQQKKLPVLVSGTTGLSKTEQNGLKTWSRRAPVLHATNFSIGVHVLNQLVGRAAALLAGHGYDPVIVEAHHKMKKDAPSGTAKTLLGLFPGTAGRRIPVHSIRKGKIIGNHFVGFFGSQDEILIEHRAHSREIFARGAIEAAIRLKKLKVRKGLFQLGDIYGGF
jgi:4-hydroxy-tetrahydrodipicolinate reductase